MNLSVEDYSLLTDLYQLTMAACYTGEGVETKRASFELFIRHLPTKYNKYAKMKYTNKQLIHTSENKTIIFSVNSD